MMLALSILIAIRQLKIRIHATVRTHQPSTTLLESPVQHDHNEILHTLSDSSTDDTTLSLGTDARSHYEETLQHLPSALLSTGVVSLYLEKHAWVSWQ